jgi:DNA-binding NarL/FixJ family response regulator
MIRILITDDHPVVRKGIRQILEDEPGVELIHEAANGRELKKKIEEQDYDVVLLDISLPGQSGLDLIPQIKKRCPDTAILVISIHSEKVYAINSFKVGASGYLNKGSAPDELVKAVFRVARGGRYIPETLASILVDTVISDKDKPPMELLSGREKEIAIFISEGKAIKEIAGELTLSPKTISTYRERVLKKLNLRTTADLIRFVLKEEWTIPRRK